MINFNELEEQKCKQLLEGGKKYYEVAQLTNLPYEKIIERDVNCWRIRVNNKVNWTTEKEEIAVKMLKEGKHYVDVANAIDVNTKSIQHRNSNVWKIPLQQERVFKHSFRTPEVESKICKLFKLGVTIGVINSELDYLFSTNKSISDILKKHGYDPKKYHKEFVHWNEHYFDFIDSEEKAYFLGLIFTDGWITKSKSKIKYDIGICLEIEDKYMVEKFKNAVNSDRSIVIKKLQKKDGTVGEYAQFVLTSDILAKALMRYGITERKSETMSINLNEIPNEHIHHFMRGMFDGNGSTYIGTEHNNLQFSMSGTTDIIEFFRYYIWSKGIAGFAKKHLCKEISFPFYQISYADKRQVYKLYKEFSRDTNIYLHRKWDKMREWLEVNIEGCVVHSD